MALTAAVRRAASVGVLLFIVAACESPDVTAPAPDDHVRGPSDAKVTLIEYGDYQCPPCSNSALAVERLLAEHPRDLRFVYRHFPTRRHRNAVPAAKAAEAAEQQGKFWEMHAMLLAKQQEWYGAGAPKETFLRYARELGLDETRFRAAADSDQLERRIRDSHEHGRTMGVRGAPAFFLNGKRLMPTPLSHEDLKRHVTAALAAQ
ncbi:MAG TPA: thioredoxin domain-containing protein [Thermoanaerobaculia bacterium]|nr:thioredoxin domain-containing protein [Thermoanaerobaculia bacterium]